MSRSFRHIEQGEGAAKAASFSTPAGFTDRFAQAWRTRSEALDARKHWLEEELRHDGQTEPAWKLACVNKARLRHPSSTKSRLPSWNSTRRPRRKPAPRLLSHS